MKKLLCILTALLLMLLAGAAFAEYAQEGLEFDDYTYNITEEDTVAIVQFTSFDDIATLKVPAQIDGYPVTQLNEYAFSGCPAASIVLPEGIVSIGDGCFAYSDALEKVTLPSTLVSLGESAFEDCSSLISVVIPGKVEEIGRQTFKGCASLTSVEIPASVKYIGNSAFYDCTALEAIDLKEGLEVIDSFAFNGCESLTEVKLPQSILELGDFALAYCPSLTSVNLPSGMTYVGNEIVKESENAQLIVEDPDSYAAIVCHDFHLNYVIMGE